MINFKIKELMESKKMSRYKLQKLTNWNYRRIKAYFFGRVKQCTLEELEILCRIFECDISDLMEFKNSN